VVREVPDTRFLIVGEGELRGQLERQIHELGLDRHVTLTGFRSDVLGLLKSLDVFAMSSITEGLGSAILEAMACRRPVVATRAGGIPEAVDDNVTGLIVPPQDDTALAAGILRLLRSPELRDQFGQAGRQRVIDSFSVERLVQGTAGVYERWLTNPSVSAAP
jgi:glycosyltransferase involved in cell wall biosynthesis